LNNFGANITINTHLCLHVVDGTVNYGVI